MLRWCVIFFVLLTEVTVHLSDEEYSKVPTGHDGSYFYFGHNVMYTTCIPTDYFSLLTDAIYQTHK